MHARSVRGCECRSEHQPASPTAGATTPLLLRCRPQRSSATVRCRASTAAPAGLVASPFDSITAERGFLPSQDPRRALLLSRHNDAAAAWEAALAEVPKLAVAVQAASSGDDTSSSRSSSCGRSSSKGVLRRALEALPPFPLDQLLLLSPAATPITAAAAAAAAAGAPQGDHTAADQGTEELWRSYLLLSFLAHAYMWCEPGPPPAVLPAVLAVPWARVSAAVGMPPVLTYATYNLLNWRRLDPAGPVQLGNIVCLHNFLGGPDEEWFRLVHVDIEARAGPAVAGLARLQQAAAQDDAPSVLARLHSVSIALRGMQSTLSRMGGLRRCRW
ncbi:hypothetical protein HYH02_004521 [Chlamydomonas schloesseri]|uniref:Uncharacterized protein n=1 Tax=Chlamydomonas schloesseri TaxID=2026947 RepID=A0A836B8A2_9CHLO|nr:hypothetical protein HYH02_004521 [Chlamydomonas schloesseri]|eukprot:KAG2450682.1 hypothetical protein HYH02_004521 [Chlamydomonas schloesseri]